MKLILVRHGETRWNEEKRVQGGSSDIELSDAGVKQAHELASFLKDEDISVVISSPLKRARDTADVIASQHQLPVQIDDRLKELEVGELEGMPISTLKTTFSQFLMRWWDTGGSKRLPGGESLLELQQRVWAAIEHLLANHKGGVVVVSHYFVVLAIIFKAIDLPLNSLTKFRVNPAGVSILEVEDYGTRLVAFNDTSY